MKKSPAVIGGGFFLTIRNSSYTIEKLKQYNTEVRMEYITLFIILAIIVNGSAWYMYRATVTLAEAAIGVAIQGAVVAALFFGAFYSTGKDVQILNGMVTSKVKEYVSCEHSYQICSGSGKSRSCTTHYRHSNDWDWLVHSTVGTKAVPRIDERGSKEPPRWTVATVGEFFALEDTYFNYIKASPLTIFDKSALETTATLPPDVRVHDIYRANRVINQQSKFNKNLPEMNIALNEKLKTLGNRKKVNIVVIFHSGSTEYVEAVKAQKFGGKINDVTVMINADADGKLNDVEVFSWSRADVVNIKVRDAILDTGVIDALAFVNAITYNVDMHYAPRSIEEFQYLEGNIELPTWAVWIISIFGLVFPFIWGYISHAHLEIGNKFSYTRSNFRRGRRYH